jgi:hypothetical protein
VLRQHDIDSSRLIVTDMLPKEDHLVAKRQVSCRACAAAPLGAGMYGLPACFCVVFALLFLAVRAWSPLFIPTFFALRFLIGRWRRALLVRVLVLRACWLAGLLSEQHTRRTCLWTRSTTTRTARQ